MAWSDAARAAAAEVRRMKFTGKVYGVSRSLFAKELRAGRATYRNDSRTIDVKHILARSYARASVKAARNIGKKINYRGIKTR